MSRTSNSNAKQTPRVVAAYILRDVLSNQASLSQLDKQTHALDAKDKAFVQALCYGSCRYFHLLNGCLQQLMQKPLKDKDADLLAILISGAYQLSYMRVPSYAAIDSSVEACRGIGKKWACKMVNGVLRNFERQHETLMANLKPWQIASHPQWLLDRIKQDWPDQYSDILQANNQQAPMCLRLSPTQWRSEYQSLLQDNDITSHACNHSDQGLRLDQAVNVMQLPYFDEGLISVQDEAAQLAGLLLDPQDGDLILDACAAPGGKTCHILELADVELLALDIDSQRCERIEENLERLQLQAAIQVADAAEVQSWWDERLFDRILLDAPCSASGVIRRHPDIKCLRTADDIAALSEIQNELLESLWSTLKVGGRLLYTTCSIFSAENEQQIARFSAQHNDAKVITITADWGVQLQFGRQLLPQEDGPDGFYYALLEKTK